MTTALIAATESQTCDSCGAPARPGAQFCGKCGTTIADPGSASPGRSGRAVRVLGLLGAVLVGTAAIAGLALAIVTFREEKQHSRNEERSRVAAVSSIKKQITGLRTDISVLRASNTALARRLQTTQSGLVKSSKGVAPLAQKVLRSVFTLESSYGSGTAFAAWMRGDTTYLITAEHVVHDAIVSGETEVQLKQKGGSWTARIERTDAVNDLAVVSVARRLAPTLWQKPELDIQPMPGDQLLLIGSPYGLEGTVTTGIVSRMTYNEIQTDAAANPGNSGGPAVDSAGRLVGVLLAGGGENLNFAVPIQRACVTIRKC